MIEIPEYKVYKAAWGYRRRNRDPAVFVLPNGHVRLGMIQFLGWVVSSIVIETHGDRNNVFGYYVSINFIVEIDIRIVLKLLQVRRGEECKSMTLQRLF